MGKNSRLKQQRKLEKQRQEQLQATKKHLTRRRFCQVAALTSITLGVTGVGFLAKPLIISAFRQNHLDNLFEGVEMPYCSQVIYDHTGRKVEDYLRKRIASHESDQKIIEEAIAPTKEIVKDGWFYAKTPEVFDLSGEGHKSDIFVGRRPFEESQPDDDLKFMIAVHEHRHAEQHAKGLGALGYLDKETIIKGIEDNEINHDTLYGVGEVDAFTYELRKMHSEKSGVSIGYYNKTKRDYFMYYNGLQMMLKQSSPVQKELISNVLKKNQVDFKF